jgi:hypothetical protein
VRIGKADANRLLGLSLPVERLNGPLRQQLVAGALLVPVKRISVESYSGPVVDFKTETGAFVAPQALVHNSEDLWHHLMRNPRWVTLRQWIRDDLAAISQEVWNAPPDYPSLSQEVFERDAKLHG